MYEARFREILWNAYGLLNAETEVWSESAKEQVSVLYTLYLYYFCLQ